MEEHDLRYGLTGRGDVPALWAATATCGAKFYDLVIAIKGSSKIKEKLKAISDSIHSRSSCKESAEPVQAGPAVGSFSRVERGK